MFGIASDNPDIPCPDCRRIMVEVRGFSRALGLDVGIREEYTMPVDYFGRANGGAVLFFFEVLNNLLDGILGFFHKQKARRVCRKLLNEAPNSLICTNCLFVYRRK